MLAIGYIKKSELIKLIYRENEARVICTMDGNFIKRKGFSLVELLIVLCIAGMLTTLTMQSYQSGKKITSRYLAKSHLLKLQSIQARYWMSSDAFVSLSKLPSINTGGVEITEVSSSQNHYEYQAVLTYFDINAPCRKLIVTNTALLPRQCWLAN